MVTKCNLRRTMKTKFIIIAAAVILIVTVVLLYYLHLDSEKEFVQRFQAEQLVASRQLAREIESYLHGRAQGVNVLSSFTSLQNRDMKNPKMFLILGFHPNSYGFSMNYSVVIQEKTNDALKKHLIHLDRQEDLCFALYSKAEGINRFSGIINEIIFPETGDRNLHGNVSFNPEYFDKVVQISLEKNKGIVFIHSHPGPGWQGMSRDDTCTEKMLAPRVKAVTNLPLLGMTIGNNGDWSARFWNKKRRKVYNCDWCESVRIVGNRFAVTFNDKLLEPPMMKEELIRTVSAWGECKQVNLSRIKVGVVGIGSVGSQIAEALMRTGVQNISLIDFDLIERKNLDRLHGIHPKNIGYLKSDSFAKILSENRLYQSQTILSYPFSVIEKRGFEAVIDCDIVFCCVDRPWARFVLNCIAYSYLIPVIDGGIDASYSKKSDNLEQARWRTYTVAPQRRCMKCMEQYKPEDVSLEQTGLLEDQLYIKGLPENHFVKHGENVYAFSMGLAGLQMQQFLSYVLFPKGVPYGPKEMDFVTGNIDYEFQFECEENCEFNNFIGCGDLIKDKLIARHPIAELSRKNVLKYSENSLKRNSWLKVVKFILNKISTVSIRLLNHKKPMNSK